MVPPARLVHKFLRTQPLRVDLPESRRYGAVYILRGLVIFLLCRWFFSVQSIGINANRTLIISSTIPVARPFDASIPCA
jgi:hypothetical protein